MQLATCNALNALQQMPPIRLIGIKLTRDVYGPAIEVRYREDVIEYKRLPINPAPFGLYPVRITKQRKEIFSLDGAHQEAALLSFLATLG